MVILCHQYWKLHGDLEPFRRTAALEKAMRLPKERVVRVSGSDR